MPDNGSIQKRDAHEMAHGRPVQITEHTTVTELQPSLSDVVCANKKLQIGFIVALVVLAAFRQPWYRACRAIPREIFAHDFVVGWPGHLNPVCVGALCGVARHSRALEHERCPAPCGDARAGGCRDRHGARARERMGVAEGR